ncbi:Ribosomal RNA small subunit methyltransferase A [Gimesia panareensis]|uniref:Ribosomal RNA small subunit methyltransferase A n=1 Tax=Gimesia panareensis TaxID=2527978 RepID=A0A518FVG2_9PLAN|nr:methyltransferase type 12 [Gimesia panareensis]QDV20334.1 Ribosomal RNA small subunit methyltransferase A [Gimesia panareensis]
MIIPHSAGEDTTSVTSTLPCFLRGFFENPLQVASCIPSSSYLQRKLSSLSCMRSAQTVIELGPGTGETTQALLDAMPAQSKLLCIEVVEEFADHLMQTSDPRLIVESGSALNLDSILKRNWFPSSDVIVSGVPFSVLSPEEGHSLMHSIYQELAPGGAFVTYQFRSSVCDLADEFFGPPDQRSIVLWNLPPLEIFVWKKTDLRGHHLRPGG